MLTQRAWLLRRLRKGPVTSVDVYEESKNDPSVRCITRCSGVILRLREKYDIHSESINHHTGFCRYVLLAEESPELPINHTA